MSELRREGDKHCFFSYHVQSPVLWARALMHTYCPEDYILTEEEKGKLKLTIPFGNNRPGSTLVEYGRSILDIQKQLDILLSHVFRLVHQEVPAALIQRVGPHLSARFFRQWKDFQDVDKLEDFIFLLGIRSFVQHQGTDLRGRLITHGTECRESSIVGILNFANITWTRVSCTRRSLKSHW